MVSFSLSCMLWESMSLYSIPWGLSCAVFWCLCHWRNTANPSLACVSPRVLSVQVRRAGHQWLKPSNGPQHGGCCFSSSSLAAEDAGQADDLFQQCHILSFFSLCSQNSGRQGTTLSWKSDKYDLQFSSVAQSCPALCKPMNHSMPGLPVHHQLPEFTQTHVYRVGDAIQPSHPLSSPFPPAPNPSQHQGLFQWVSSSHEVAKVLEFQLQHHSFKRTPRTDLL